MRQIVLVSILFLIQPFNAWSDHDPEFTELVILYADEDYEKCLKKSLKYIDKPETKKEPLPYIYASMAYFEMSRDGRYKETYPRAYKRALTYAVKYRKKDKTGVHFEDYATYWSELKAVAIEEAENYIAEASHLGREGEKYYRKALYGMKKITGFDPDDAGAWLLRGTLEIQTRNRKMGQEYTKKAQELMTDMTVKQLAEESSKSQYLLRYAVIHTSKFYISQNRLEEAREIMEAGKPLFYKKQDVLQITYNKEFKELWDDLSEG